MRERNRESYENTHGYGCHAVEQIPHVSCVKLAFLLPLVQWSMLAFPCISSPHVVSQRGEKASKRFGVRDENNGYYFHDKNK